MTTGSKFLDDLGIEASFREIEVANIAREYSDEYSRRMADFLDLFLETHCHCFKVTNLRTNVTEEFLLPYKISEVY